MTSDRICGFGYPLTRLKSWMSGLFNLVNTLRPISTWSSPGTTVTGCLDSPSGLTIAPTTIETSGRLVSVTMAMKAIPLFGSKSLETRPSSSSWISMRRRRTSYRVITQPNASELHSPYASLWPEEKTKRNTTSIIHTWVNRSISLCGSRWYSFGRVGSMWWSHQPQNGRLSLPSAEMWRLGGWWPLDRHWYSHRGYLLVNYRSTYRIQYITRRRTEKKVMNREEWDEIGSDMERVTSYLVKRLT